MSQAREQLRERLGHVDAQVLGACLDVARSGRASPVPRTSIPNARHAEPPRARSSRARGCPSSTRAALAPRRTSSSPSGRPAGRRCRRRSAGRRRAAAPSSAPPPRPRSGRAGWRPGPRGPRLLPVSMVFVPAPARITSASRSAFSNTSRPTLVLRTTSASYPPRLPARSAALSSGIDDAGVAARLELGDGRLDDGVGEKHAHSNPPSCPCSPHGSGPWGDRSPVSRTRRGSHGQISGGIRRSVSARAQQTSNSVPVRATTPTQPATLQAWPPSVPNTDDPT